ncbi:MAG: hypothetical protein FJW37_07975, partial [Acidobacteria bacterium]|nr:hypothetical protein [Acidobacteriota bacterium]
DAEVALNIRSSSRFTARVFERCRGLRLVSIWGTGADNVDLAAAAASGVRVTNTPGVSAISIAEHCLALLLAVARRIPQIDRETRAGGWPRGSSLELHNKTLGIIGLGAIGSRFARLGRGIGMRVIAWTRAPRLQPEFQMVALEELLRASDVVSLHLRLSGESRDFIGGRELEMMRPSAILINTARGAIVNEEALIRALTAKRIAGAGLDVFEQEPLPAGHALARLDNVVLTPHCAGITPEALEAGLAMAVENIRGFLEGRAANVVA